MIRIATSSDERSDRKGSFPKGALELQFEANPMLTSAQIERILKKTVRDFGTRGFDTTWGWGEINAPVAVKK